MMTNASKAAQEIFWACQAVEDRGERSSKLTELCDGDVALRKRVEMLLCAGDVDDEFLETPFGQSALGDPDDAQENDGSATATQLTGRAIGDFQILHEIGRGGMGVVYEAEQISLGRSVALKVLPYAALLDKRQLARFKNEARAAATLDHPNVVHVHSVGADRGVHYYAMQLIDGRTVADLIATEQADRGITDNSLPASHDGSSKHDPTDAPSAPQANASAPSEALHDTAKAGRSEATARRNRNGGQEKRIPAVVKLAIQAASALEHAHQMGVVHRDIKPSNLLVDDEHRLWVADFGLAMIESEGNLTTSGSMLGTLRYMSPEQMQADRSVLDHRTDIYSLGATLYEMLTLRPVFTDRDVNHLMQRIATDEPLAPGKLNAAIPRDLETIVQKALSKAPQDRYDSAAELGADLQRHLDDEPIRAKRPGILERASKWTRRHRAVVSSTVATLVVAVLIAGGLLWNEHNQTLAALNLTQDQKQIAEQQEELARGKQREALQQRDKALANQYRAEIFSGQADWEHGYLARLRSKLMAHLPVADQPDRRGWEWYYLLSLCHPERQTLYFPRRTLFATWSPDGEYIAASGCIWRADSGENVRRLTMSGCALSRSAWSPDGQMFAWGTTSDDSCVYIWNRQTDEVSELRGHEQSVWCVAWSPDGKQLASSGSDQDVRIWDVAAESTIKTLRAEDFVTDVSWSPDGELLAAGIKWNRLTIWNPATGELVADRKGLGSRGSTYRVQLSWHPDGEQLAVSTPQSWFLFDRSDWTVVRQQDLELGRGRDIAWHPDGQKIAVADGTVVSIWEPAADEPVRTLRGHLRIVTAVAWSPDGDQLVTSDSKEEIKIWDLNSAIQPLTISTGFGVQSLSWLPGSNTLAVANETDGATSFWHAVDGRRLKVESAVAKGQTLWSPARRLVAQLVNSESGPRIRILEATTGAVHSIWQGDAGDLIRQFAWSNDGAKLAIRKNSGTKTTVELWDVDRETQISRWTHNGTPSHRDIFQNEIAWSPDGTHLAIAAMGDKSDNGTPAHQGRVYVVNAARGTTILKHNLGGWSHTGIITSLAWNPAGRALVGGNSQGLVEAIAVDSGRTLFSTRLHNTNVHSISWSPDGDRIVSASEDGSIKVLASTGGEDLLAFTLEDGVKHVAWSHDGKRLAAATEAGDIHVWDASLGYEFSEQGRRRGELARAYYRAPTHETSAAQQARLRQALRLAPDTLGFWEVRGHASAELGDYDRAVQEFAKAIEPGLRRSFRAAPEYGNALLGAAKLETYRRHCVSMLDQFTETHVPSSGGLVAWLCALTKNDDIDTGTVLRLARAAASDRHNSGEYNFTLWLGATLYRDGQYDQAAAVLTELTAELERSTDPTKRDLNAASLYFLAMSRYQLGHPFQARRSLDDAVNVAAEVSLHSSWSVGVQLKTLDQEARELIRS